MELINWLARVYQQLLLGAIAMVLRSRVIT
jgi:hypothetical protein